MHNQHWHSNLPINEAALVSNTDTEIPGEWGHGTYFAGVPSKQTILTWKDELQRRIRQFEPGPSKPAASSNGSEMTSPATPSTSA